MSKLAGKFLKGEINDWQGAVVECVEVRRTIDGVEGGL